MGINAPTGKNKPLPCQQKTIPIQEKTLCVHRTKEDPESRAGDQPGRGRTPAKKPMRKTDHHDR